MDDVSFILINNPEVDLVINTSNKAKSVFGKNSSTGNFVILAPGEDKTPSNIMRESNFDAKASKW